MQPTEPRRDADRPGAAKRTVTRRQRAALALAALALAALALAAAGCASIEADLRDQIARTARQFETYAEASALRPLTPEEERERAEIERARADLERELRRFFETEGRLK